MEENYGWRNLLGLGFQIRMIVFAIILNFLFIRSIALRRPVRTVTLTRASVCASSTFLRKCR